MKIFITGCGGSGTTLLRKLFYSFDDVEVIDKQISLLKFCKLKPKKKFLVGKRASKDLFTGRGNEQIKHAQLIKKNNIYIVNIIRDGRDIFPRVFDLKPIDWIKSMDEREMYKNLINLEICYENLVTHPNKEQKRIIRKIGLKQKFRFSDYPEFMPWFDGIEKVEPYGHGLRRINNNSVGKGLDVYKEMCNKTQLKLFHNHLTKLGYL